MAGPFQYDPQTGRTTEPLFGLVIAQDGAVQLALNHAANAAFAAAAAQLLAAGHPPPPGGGQTGISQSVVAGGMSLPMWASDP